MKDIINSLKFKESYEAIDSIVESNKFNSSNIKYLSKQLYKEPFYIENILQIGNNYYINAMLTEYLQNKIINRNFTSGMAEDKIKYFYYQHPDYFAKLNVQLEMYILQTYAGKFNEIPTINDKDTRQKIYDLIVKNKRYEINLINLNHIFENFENSPLKCILGNTSVYGYIRESNRLDIIKDLNPGEDSIKDLITLLQSGNDVTKLIDSKYIKQFSHSIDIDTTYSTLISKLIDFNLIKFSDYNILQCSSKFGNSIELIKFISNSIKDGNTYELKDNKKFNTTLSTYLITELSVAELSVIKESIDTSIFNNAGNLSKIDIEKVKLFEKQIILTRPVIITCVDNNNLSLLKDILNACQAIKIDKSGHSADSIRLNKVKKLGLRRLYGLFKD